MDTIHESTAPINNTDAFLSYSGNWVYLRELS
ncbi:MAG: hypothetical protein KatS3mg068_1043 [Candidatus Sericytochromatia bacterium]|nr:MAG: hypothetical protein KatS3mg068_1043 [Candidatus Sericytochromatia bacterium]